MGKMPIKIFVGNLTSDTTENDIRPLFEKYGTITECDVLRNFGFVHMEKEDEANAAIEELAGTLVKGSRINVEKSTGISKGSGRGFGGGKMSGGRGRIAVRMRGYSADYPARGRYTDTARDYDPYDPYGFLRVHPYYRDPYGYGYDYYDRSYPRSLPPEDRRSYYDRDRLPLPRDYYDRYATRYPLPADRYAAYDRYPARSAADPYERPPPDYYRYRANDGYDDPPRNKASDQSEHLRPLNYGGDQLGMTPSYTYSSYYQQPVDWMTGGQNPQNQQARATAAYTPATMTDFTADRQLMGQPNPSNPGYHWQGTQQYP